MPDVHGRRIGAAKRCRKGNRAAPDSENAGLSVAGVLDRLTRTDFAPFAIGQHRLGKTCFGEREPFTQNLRERGSRIDLQCY